METVIVFRIEKVKNQLFDFDYYPQVLFTPKFPLSEFSEAIGVSKGMLISNFWYTIERSDSTFGFNLREKRVNADSYTLSGAQLTANDFDKKIKNIFSPDVQHIYDGLPIY